MQVSSLCRSVSNTAQEKIMNGIDLSFGLVDRQLPLAAPDDLSLVTGPNPYDPTLNSIFLQNNNINRGIVAAVRVDGANPLRVQSLDRTGSQNRWPLRFEARVPPGSLIMLAPTQVNVRNRVTTGGIGDPADVTVVTQVVTLEGAYYRDPPYPADPAPESVMRVYSCPIVNGDPDFDSLDLMVNLHSSRAVTLSCEPVGADPIARMGTVPPGLQLLWDQWAEPLAWRVVSAKYF
jgi:hypothetical protein